MSVAVFLQVDRVDRPESENKSKSNEKSVKAIDKMKRRGSFFSKCELWDFVATFHVMKSVVRFII